MVLAATMALLIQAEAPQATTKPPAPPKCDTAGYAQFDFWVGDWDVFPAGSDKQVATSKIERLYNGCAVRENWQPFSGNSGGSLNSYDPKTGQWHQRWIGSSPGKVDFIGGKLAQGMVLTGNWPAPGAAHQLIRMTYSKNEDGSVRQHGESSVDHGVSWKTAFDFIYRPQNELPAKEPTE